MALGRQRAVRIRTTIRTTCLAKATALPQLWLPMLLFMWIRYDFVGVYPCFDRLLTDLRSLTESAFARRGRRNWGWTMPRERAIGNPTFLRLWLLTSPLHQCMIWTVLRACVLTTPSSLSSVTWNSHPLSASVAKQTFSRYADDGYANSQNCLDKSVIN